MLYSARRSGDKQLLIRPFLRKIKKYEYGGRLIFFKLTFYFMAITHEPLYLDKLSFVHWKIMDIPTRFILIIIFNGPTENSDGGVFKLLRCMQNLRQYTCDHNILYGDRFLEDGQLLVRPFLREPKTRTWTRIKINIRILFYGATYEPLRLDKITFRTLNDLEHNYNLYMKRYFSTELLNMTVFLSSEVMLGLTLNYFV
jgi:hypothetical protein